MTDNNDTSKTAMQVHDNPDPDPVCEVEEDHVCEVEEDHIDEEEEEEKVRASSKLTQDEQQNLEAVPDTDLPSHDINEPTPTQYQDDVEVSYGKSNPPQPVPVIIDEGLDDDVSQMTKPTLAANNTPQGSDDRCCQFRCCGCPNGAVQIVFAQFFLFVGLGLCFWAMTDCAFIEATAGFPDPYVPPSWPNYYNYDPNAPPSAVPSTSPTEEPEELEPVRRGFGFVLNETAQGGCFSNAENRYWHEEEFYNYSDFLGNDWHIPRVLGGAALTLGILLFLWTFLFWCCSFVKAVRWVIGLILFLIVAGFQASTFAVLGSGFCKEEDADCEPSRGFWMMLAGICCYWISAFFFCCMKDFPGPAAR